MVTILQYSSKIILKLIINKEISKSSAAEPLIQNMLYTAAMGIGYT